MNKKLEEALSNDRFRKFLNAEILEIGDGYARVRGVVKEDYTNVHGTAHGAFIVALADFALAIAGNSDNIRRMAITIKLDFLKPAYVGDRLVAEASRAGGGRKVVFFDLRVWRGKDLIAKGDAIVYGKGEAIVDVSDQT